MWPFDWWRRFWRHIEYLADSRESIDLEELKELAEANPIKKYVNFLILEMARGKASELTLRKSIPLPPSKLEADAEIPAFDRVINRLKVMTNLWGVICRPPKEGILELRIGGSDAVVHVRFDDNPADRSVHLRLEWLDETPAPGRLA